MGPIGVPEMLFILAIALLIFGPKRLPEFGRTIGKALGEFRRATTDLKRSIDVEIASGDHGMPEPSTQAASKAAAAAAGQPVARDRTADAGDEPEADDSADGTAAAPAGEESGGGPSAGS